MFGWENKIADWIEKNIKILALTGAAVVGLLIRISLLNVISPDYTDFLEQWFNVIKESGGLKGLGTSVGNYNFLYQTLIALLTYLPINCLYSYKLLSIIFDVTLAFSVWVYVKNIFCDKNNDWPAIISWSLVWLIPTVFIDSAAWSQCDSMYATFCILTLYYLQKETRNNYVKAFALYGLAISFKLQAVFILPFLLFFYLKKREFSIFTFLVSPVVMFLTGIPCLIAGRPITQLFSLYKGQVTEYSGKLSYFYPGIWLVYYEPSDYDLYINYRNAAILVAIAALSAVIVYWLVKKYELTSNNILFMAFLLTYTMVMFLPAMHERYGYVYMILAIMIAVRKTKTIPLLAILSVLDLITYSGYINNYWKDFSLFGILVLAFVNIAVYGAYMYILNRDMQRDSVKAD